MTAATKPVVNQTSCVVPGPANCNTSAVFNKAFNMYIQKNGPTSLNNPTCVTTSTGQKIAVYEFKSDDGQCTDQVRPSSEAYRCAPVDNSSNGGE